MEKLKVKIESIVVEAGGDWAIVIEDLDTAERLAINEDELFAAMSIIKLPIMAALFAAEAVKEADLSELITLKRADIVGGAGNIQFLSLGTRLSIYDLITLMIIQSDNTATNILIDLVGFEKIEEMMTSIGMEKSCLRKKLMIYPVTGDKDIENYITARETSLFLKELAFGKVISRYSSEKMIKILKQQQIRNALPAYLPPMDNEVIGVIPKWEFANKTGWGGEYQHDAGILYVNQRSISITVLSKNRDSIKSVHALAKIGQEVFQYIGT